MSILSKAARIAVLLFSLTLLAGYVVYSHVTPNTPPPDPLGLNEVELRQEPDSFAFGGTVKADNTSPSSELPANELRIISSKVINQPVFSVHQHPRPSFKALLHLWNRSDGPAVHYVDPNIRFHMFSIHLEPLYSDEPTSPK
ncbi:MAG: hypothetical protein Q8M07_24245 [Prosthecobacter sp.]|nr:hypothetical protein [Prosthecobacter sp.]